MRIKEGNKVRITNLEGTTFEGRVVSVEFSGWIVEPIEGVRCTLFVPDNWKVEVVDDDRSISPVLDEAINTAKSVQRLLNATQHYMNLVPDEAKAAIDEAIVRLEETMDGLDSGTIQLIVALGQIKEIF